ncbi:MAG TPA: hypothetical protein VGO92_06465 [Acidimicrobiales bacterium]|nr:hypothetical protein [Acidimicrobiales bacterium]
MTDQALHDGVRHLPGVLDCSLDDDGLAVLVDPEVDARVVQARLETMLWVLDEERPLVLVGGSPTARSTLPLWLSVAALVALVLLVLVLLPLP